MNFVLYTCLRFYYIEYIISLAEKFPEKRFQNPERQIQKGRMIPLADIIRKNIQFALKIGA